MTIRHSDLWSNNSVCTVDRRHDAKVDKPQPVYTGHVVVRRAKKAEVKK